MKEYKSPLIYMWQYLNRSVFEFIRSSRKVITLPVPTTPGETVNLYLSAPETIVKFEGDIQVDFTLNVVSVKNRLGDKLYLTFSSTSSGYQITASGDLNFNNCGPDSPPSDHGVDEGTTAIPFLYDGTAFYGMDYC
ncbi:MAG: hypothetical protein RLZZ196_293 [Bacteroidota bacterium]|jgi:hypothetical protein